MRIGLSTMAVLAGVGWASPALPCGGGFGQNLTIAKEQTIVVAHDGTSETYVFQPHFCGQAAEFGLILPVPAALSANPALAQPALFSELDAVTAPRHETRKICNGSKNAGVGGGSSDAGIDRDGGIAVVDKGQVGIFDWSLLKADSAASFTAWLDANSYPHAPSADTQFAHYVQQGWYFVAFKVTAASAAPEGGLQLCGDFGPIQLVFPAATPVVPTRIAAVSSASSSSLSWRIYTLAPQQMTTDSTQWFRTQRRFSGTLDADVLANRPQLSQLAQAGTRLTKLDVTFNPYDTAPDLQLQATASEDYREVVYDDVYEDCGVSCSISTAAGWREATLTAVLTALGVMLMSRLQRRRRQRERS